MSTETTKRPNFLIASPARAEPTRSSLIANPCCLLLVRKQIVADDLGFSDIGAFGSEVSPHDALLLMLLEEF
jgi:hypothetical protein